MVADPSTDRVLTAIVGAAGLEGTWAALEAGKTVALANKETLVVAGPLVMDLARRRGATILPVDSEHSAIFQAMACGKPKEVRRVILTSSGGPFRGRTARELAGVTPEQALRHPTWKMGPKISIDSATLMNKALEVIEARWLFGLEPEQIEVVVHPESMVHSMVEFVDGSVRGPALAARHEVADPVRLHLSRPGRGALPDPRPDPGDGASISSRRTARRSRAWTSDSRSCAGRGRPAPRSTRPTRPPSTASWPARSASSTSPEPAARRSIHHPFDPRPTLEALWRVDAWARQEVRRWKP